MLSHQINLDWDSLSEDEQYFILLYRSFISLFPFLSFFPTRFIFWLLKQYLFAYS